LTETAVIIKISEPAMAAEGGCLKANTDKLKLVFVSHNQNVG